MKNQKAFEFDPVTTKKILKGALIALTGSAGIGLLSYIGTLEIKDETATMIIAWAVPTLINGIKEWMKEE